VLNPARSAADIQDLLESLATTAAGDFLPWASPEAAPDTTFAVLIASVVAPEAYNGINKDAPVALTALPAVVTDALTAIQAALACSHVRAATVFNAEQTSMLAYERLVNFEKSKATWDWEQQVAGAEVVANLFVARHVPAVTDEHGSALYIFGPTCDDVFVRVPGPDNNHSSRPTFTWMSVNHPDRLKKLLDDIRTAQHAHRHNASITGSGSASGSGIARHGLEYLGPLLLANSHVTTAVTARAAAAGQEPTGVVSRANVSSVRLARFKHSLLRLVERVDWSSNRSVVSWPPHARALWAHRVAQATTVAETASLITFLVTAIAADDKSAGQLLGDANGSSQGDLQAPGSFTTEHPLDYVPSLVAVGAVKTVPHLYALLGLVTSLLSARLLPLQPAE
jgi:hypothetical protein